MDAMIVNLTTEASRFAVRAVVALLLLIGFWLAGVMVQRLTARLERAEHARQDVVPLLGQVAKGTLIVLGVVTALGTVGVNVTALVAGLGLTGFALGFAFRDVLSNLLAGLLLLVYRPFARHDLISVTGYEGTVTGVDLRYTTLQRDDGKVLIPNSILFTNPIQLRSRTP
jgi:small conductance mechanosensitive channel